MSVEPLTKQPLEFLSLSGDYTGPSESIDIKMPHCWKSYVTAHFRWILYDHTCILLYIRERCSTISDIITQALRLYIIYYNYKGIKWEQAQQVNHLISL